MNLPNDVSRCVGRLDFGHTTDSFCPHRSVCERHLQMDRDREAKLESYQGICVMMHCRADGEYTMQIHNNKEL